MTLPAGDVRNDRNDDPTASRLSGSAGPQRAVVPVVRFRVPSQQQSATSQQSSVQQPARSSSSMANLPPKASTSFDACGKELALRIDGCQYRRMSMLRTPLPVLEPFCCTPLTREPLAEVEAAALAVRFKALADPVRLRLLSLVLA